MGHHISFAAMLVGTLLVSSACQGKAKLPPADQKPPAKTATEPAKAPTTPPVQYPLIIVPQMQQIILKAANTKDQDVYTTFSIDGHGYWDMYSHMTNNAKIDGDHFIVILKIPGHGKTYVFAQTAGINARRTADRRNQGKTGLINAFQFDFRKATLEFHDVGGDGSIITYVKKHEKEIAAGAVVVTCIATSGACGATF